MKIIYTNFKFKFYKISILINLVLDHRKKEE